MPPRLVVEALADALSSAAPDAGVSAIGQNPPVDDHRLCRISISAGKLELAGPATA
jgi:hypothetical protein